MLFLALLKQFQIEKNEQVNFKEMINMFIKYN